jgi:hypothetical protein
MNPKTERSANTLSALPSPLSPSIRLSALNARLNAALDAATEYLTFALLVAWCELGRLKDRVVWRARTKTVCSWCKHTTRLRWFFWQRDNAQNVSHGLCRACQQELFFIPPLTLNPNLNLNPTPFPPPAVSETSDLHGLADLLSARREK